MPDLVNGMTTSHIWGTEVVLGAVMVKVHFVQYACVYLMYLYFGLLHLPISIKVDFSELLYVCFIAIAFLIICMCVHVDGRSLSMQSVYICVCWLVAVICVTCVVCVLSV